MSIIITKIVAVITAIITFVSGGLVNVFDKLELDTAAGYRARVSELEFYENSLESAVPQTVIYDVISEHMNSKGEKEKKAIIIGYDGGRIDGTIYRAENAAINTMLANGALAYMGYCGGRNYPHFTVQATSTAPGWCSIITGKWGNETGVTDNSIPKSNDNLTLLTTLIQNGKAEKTAFYTSWSGHFSGDDSTYINEVAYCKEKGINAAFVRCSDDSETVSKTISDLSSENCSDFILSILEYPDHAGHDTGFSTFNPDYQKGMYDADVSAKSIIDAIKARENYENEDWLIILTSDHGGFFTGHGGLTLQERMTFIVMNKQIEW